MKISRALEVATHKQNGDVFWLEHAHSEKFHSQLANGSRNWRKGMKHEIFKIAQATIFSSRMLVHTATYSWK